MQSAQIQLEYDAFQRQGFKLDMSRGKPAPEQLDLSHALLGELGDYLAADGTDTRNYGGASGLPEARALFGELLGVPPSQIVVDGNASLALMHDVILYAMVYGMPGQPPWSAQGPLTFLCPVPGYDRHFSICEALGIKMVNVPMSDSGPDMELVEALVAGDSGIKGMWCVPKYSNPTGAVYSADVMARLAAMKTAAPDFRLLWDDAYALHHLGADKGATLNILQVCADAGNPDRAFQFASTSKITLAGAGLAALAASPANIAWWLRCGAVRSIGPDKVNQLRHVRFLKNRATVEALMESHSRLLKPKFDAMLAQFEASLGDVAGVSWTRPRGGYFIDLVTPKGLAKKTVALAREAGITLTAAGASFPYGNDENDRHIRIAPSFPSLKEIEQAGKGIALALLLAMSKAK